MFCTIKSILTCCQHNASFGFLVQELLSHFVVNRLLQAAHGSTVLTAKQLNQATPPTDLQLVFRHLAPSLHNLSRVLDRHGNTLFHEAAYSGRTDLLSLLLPLTHVPGGVARETRPLETPNLSGMTPLHAAYAGHHCEMVNELSKAGADPLIRDRFGRLPEELQFGGGTCEGGEGASESSAGDGGWGGRRDSEGGGGGGHTSCVHDGLVQENDNSQDVFWQRYLNSGWAPGASAGRGT